MNNNFQRLFYILKNMDSNVGYPTGYIKVEKNCERAKIQIALNNILDRKDMIYQLYGIKKVANDLSYTVICDIPSLNGRADVKISVDSYKVGTNNLNLEDINIFAIISSQIPNQMASIKCPLVSYKDGEVEWKKQFLALLINKDKEKAEVIEDVQSEKAEVIEDVQSEKAEVIENEQSENIEIIEDVQSEKAEVIENEQSENIEVIENEQSENIEIIENMQSEDTEIQKDETLTEIIDNSDEKNHLEEALTGIYNGYPEFTHNETDILSSAQKNFKDISSIDIDGDKRQSKLNIPSLKEELDKSFESYNPFKMRSKNFRWWKINSPGFLNNILFRNNVKSYLLFNPKVMLAHYKYRYIIFGIQNDKNSGKDYFLCGVPGVYNIDENPFGSMGSWAQLEGYKPKYGAFGYWIILIDPRTGKLMKIN